MSTNEIIENPENKAFDSASAVSSHQKLSAVQRLTIETEWTNCLQDLVNFGNKRLLNFSLRLEMDYDKPVGHRQIVYHEKEVNQ